MHSHCYLRLLRFQFTSPRGDELKMARVLIRVYHFNSRLRKETNKEVQKVNKEETNFNSRLRKETNVAVRGLKDKLDHYFSSRLRKETNMILHSPKFVKTISTHVSVRRRTAIQHLFPAPENISTHVSARRRTFDNILNKTCNLFQLTSP